MPPSGDAALSIVRIEEILCKESVGEVLTTARMEELLCDGSGQCECCRKKAEWRQKWNQKLLKRKQKRQACGKIGCEAYCANPAHSSNSEVSDMQLLVLLQDSVVQSGRKRISMANKRLPSGKSADSNARTVRPRELALLVIDGQLDPDSLFDESLFEDLPAWVRTSRVSFARRACLLPATCCEHGMLDRTCDGTAGVIAGFRG
jgi:hypothetical protein